MSNQTRCHVFAALNWDAVIPQFLLNIYSTFDASLIRCYLLISGFSDLSVLKLHTRWVMSLPACLRPVWQTRDAHFDGRIGRCRKDNDLVQVETRRNRDHHSNNRSVVFSTPLIARSFRIQRRDCWIQEHLIHRLGCRWSRQDPSIVAPLLPKHPRFARLHSCHQHCLGLIFVVDSNDRERVNEAREE